LPIFISDLIQVGNTLKYNRWQWQFGNLPILIANETPQAISALTSQAFSLKSLLLQVAVPCYLHWHDHEF